MACYLHLFYCNQNWYDMRQEKNNLYNQGRGLGRQGEQGQEMLETELDQNPNVQEVGLDRDLQEGRTGNQELGREQLGEERITESPERGDRRL
jgi:hypothetical protein